MSTVTLRQCTPMSFGKLLENCLRLLLPFVTLLAIAEGARDKVQLLGAIVDSRGGVALVKNKGTGEVKAFRIGAQIYDVGSLKEVDRYSIIIRETSGETVTISSKLNGAKMAVSRIKTVDDGDRYIEDGFSRVGNKIEVDSAYRDRMVKEELQNILMQATAEPVMENGQIAGFKIYQFDDKSIFYKLGLKEGDVVKEINGVPLTNVAKTIQFLNGLREEPNISVSVSRNGQPVNMSMTVK